MNFLKVKAGALQMTTFVVVVIALLLAAFIILIHTHKTFKVQTDFVIETIKNTDRGLRYSLNNNMLLNDTISISLDDEDYKTLKAHRDYWGLFEKVTVVSTLRNKVFKKVALIGAEQPKIDRTALYLEDNNRPLVLVGNTIIDGVTYLPKKGVRTGNISGHSYYGEQLIYGRQKTSSKLPKLNPELLKQIKAFTEIYTTIDSDQFIDLNTIRTFQNSFYKPLQIIYSLEQINLSEIKLTGHILVQSKTKITVDSSSNLKDVILIAPEIDIKNNVIGTFQALATKSVQVGSNCQLNYPSVLILNEEHQTKASPTNVKESPFIKMEKGSVIKGIITYLGDTKNYKAQVLIDDNVTITGEVYCNKNVELLGKVNGSVFTSGFVANQSGSVYQNHIYNGTIVVNKLPEEYVGLSFINSKKDIAKWLY
ncbi:hypothetical protein [Changchengzhania lutea]|uniref:hypothetical protein n=1 Tax=Changchengzhania lutea TaxID=2049305 RepID=UPI00115E064A|nr:hypothetical protein [Changchengzhania lutea]